MLIEGASDCFQAAVRIVKVKGRFGASQEQIAPQSEEPARSFKNGLLGRHIEIDHHVTKDDQIHLRQERPGLCQVKLLEGGHVMDRRLELPMRPLLVEVFDQQSSGEAPIDLNLVVARLAGPLEDLSGDITGQERNLPISELRKV